MILSSVLPKVRGGMAARRESWPSHRFLILAPKNRYSPNFEIISRDGVEPYIPSNDDMFASDWRLIERARPKRRP